MKHRLTQREIRELKGIWSLMHWRCSDPSSYCYENYGGRGIYVCDRWQSFDRFLYDMAPRPLGHVQEACVGEGTFRYRLKLGWGLEEALDTPVGGRGVPKRDRSPCATKR